MSGIKLALLSSSSSAPPGQVEFTTAGTFTWVCPAGVTSVSVVAVGCAGQTSYFGSNTLVAGLANDGRIGGGYAGDGGGYGGYGGAASSWYYVNNVPYGAGGAGGGAGGYTSNGGSGGSGYQLNNGNDGYSGGGGGVGIYGGTVGGQGGQGTGTGSTGAGGAGGSGGTAGGDGGGRGRYGGGSGGGWSGNGEGGGGLGWKNNISVTPGLSYAVQVAPNGAVRIIWGAGRSFPNTNTGNV